MKSYVKWLLVLLFIVAVGLPLLITGPNGQPIMRFSDWLPNTAKLQSMMSQLPGGQALGNRVERQFEQAGESFSIGEAALSEATTSESLLSADDLSRSPVVLSSSSGKMYKWQDDQGRWHFSTQKPLEAKNVSIEALPQVENVMDAPVTGRDNSSTISLPDFGGGGDLLKKIQRMAEGNKD